jgi:hypothetical protein
MKKKSNRNVESVFIAVKSESTVASLISKLSKFDPMAFISFDIIKDEEVFTTDIIPKIYRTEMGNIRLELNSKDYTYIFSKDHKTLESYIDTKAEIINLTEGSK